jgi:hypothetical protein
VEEVVNTAIQEDAHGILQIHVRPLTREGRRTH